MRIIILAAIISFISIPGLAQGDGAQAPPEAQIIYLPDRIKLPPSEPVFVSGIVLPFVHDAAPPCSNLAEDLDAGYPPCLRPGETHDNDENRQTGSAEGE